ncbi:hypothetical protein [Phormidesmis sp. 146-33]
MSFTQSMTTLIEHLETRRQQLDTELQETTAAIEVLKRLDGQKGDSAASPAAVVSDSNGQATPRRRGRIPRAKVEDTAATSSTFSPRTSVLRAYQGKTIRDAIKMILQSEAGEEFSVNDILYALYGKTISKDALKVARPIVLAELSKGKMANHWSNVPGRKGYYTFLEDGDSDGGDDDE